MTADGKNNSNSKKRLALEGLIAFLDKRIKLG